MKNLPMEGRSQCFSLHGCVSGKVLFLGECLRKTIYQHWELLEIYWTEVGKIEVDYVCRTEERGKKKEAIRLPPKKKSEMGSSIRDFGSLLESMPDFWNV